MCVCVFNFSSRLDQPQHMFFALEYRVERRLEINESRRLDRVNMTDEMLLSDGLYVVHDEASSTPLQLFCRIYSRCRGISSSTDSSLGQSLSSSRQLQANSRIEFKTAPIFHLRKLLAAHLELRAIAVLATCFVPQTDAELVVRDR